MQQLVDNRYRLVRPLGSGGMADVFLAHDDVLDRDVALKVMSMRYASDDEFVERFKREAQSAAALSHPNIVSIYDRGESDDGTYYIAMEYLPGGTLKDRILQRGALPPRTAAAVALQIAEALKVAHDRGVVHRDIKPHNILITGSGDVKVTDFGIARAASSTTMTRTGHILGTAHYISPEQAMGEAVGTASDLYSLGVVLYEMLTGELPFDADTPIGIAMKHVNGHLRPPREVNPGIPDGINAVTVRLLAKDPNDRYESDAELIEDLERVAAGLQPSHATTEMTTRAMPAGGALGATTAARTAQTKQAAPTAPTRVVAAGRVGKKRRRLAPLLLASLALLLLASVAWAGYNYLRAPQETARQVLDVSGDSPADAAPDLRVPTLVGMTLDEAKREVGDDFEVVEGESRDGARPAGTILDQRPRDGTAEDGSEISVTVASGQNEVPDVTGSPQAEAERVLRKAGFEVRTRREESTAAQEGSVTRQEPAAGLFGGAAEVGSTVTVFVGSGPGAVGVPDLYGSTLAQAEALLAEGGLELGVVSEDYSTDAAEGSVFYQTPANGQSVERGSAVDVTVSLGPGQIEIPSVYGMTPVEAQATLEDAGLGVNQDYPRVASEEPYDTVIDTDPPVGTTVAAGASVSIVASDGSLAEPVQASSASSSSSSDAPAGDPQTPASASAAPEAEEPAGGDAGAAGNVPGAGTPGGGLGAAIRQQVRESIQDAQGNGRGLGGGVGRGVGAGTPGGGEVEVEGEEVESGDD